MLCHRSKDRCTKEWTSSPVQQTGGEALNQYISNFKTPNRARTHKLSKNIQNLNPKALSPECVISHVNTERKGRTAETEPQTRSRNLHSETLNPGPQNDPYKTPNPKNPKPNKSLSLLGGSARTLNPPVDGLRDRGGARRRAQIQVRRSSENFKPSVNLSLRVKGLFSSGFRI